MSNKKTRFVFWLIALLLPVLFFASLEGGLRLFSYGRDVPLFIANPANSHYLLPRPDIVSRYFAKDADLPSVTMEANFLLKTKPTNGYRIFVQGGSSAAGFPYGLGASLAGMLDKRLRMSMPQHYVEVVNTAMAAVNSYTVLDLADEIIAQQPDAVMIYMGHNEYLGILGVGSNYTAANSQASTLLFLKLRRLRTFQLIQNSYAVLSEDKPELKQDFSSSRTFMAKVAKHKDIAMDSPLYTAGLSQFDTNLHLLLDKYKAASIPVYLATIASNIRDHKPFLSAPIPSDIAADLAQVNQLIQTKQNSQALALAKQLTAKISQQQNALAHFNLAHIYLELNDLTQATQHFILAKDLDLLRFRAPSAINQLIKQAAASYENVLLVDVEQQLSKHSPQGLIGNNLMLEHLHPNVQGYFLLADSFYNVFAQHANIAQWQTQIINEAWQQRPLLPSEEYNGFAKVLQLMNDYPFIQNTSEVKPLRLPTPADWQQELGKQHFLKQIDWLTMMQQALSQYQAQNDQPMALKTATILADALPHEPKINAYVAQAYQRLQQTHVADYYKQRSILANKQ